MKSNFFPKLKSAFNFKNKTCGTASLELKLIESTSDNSMLPYIHFFFFFCHTLK